MSMARLLMPHDVFDDVSGVRTDAGKDGGGLQVQPRQPDGVQPRVHRRAPGVPGIPPLVEDGQVHPSEVEAIAGSPVDRADARRIKVELCHRRRRECVVRRAVIGRGVDAGRRDVHVEHRLELHIECGVRKRQALLQVVAEPDNRHCRRFQLSVQVNSLPRAA